MKIIEAIAQIDELKPNSYSTPQKIKWLSQVDGMVKRLIIDTHECENPTEFTGYEEDTPVETELLVESPFDSMYIHWLEARIDYANGEYGKYNNTIQAYQEVWDSYKNDYNRVHMPIGKKIRYF